MRIRYALFAIALIIGTAAFSSGPSSRIADLQPELQQALEHDAALCTATPPNAAAEAGSQQLLQSPVLTEEIRVAGREAGIIAAPQDACHCRNENCSTFVYLKSGDGYKLVLTDALASLHPMKIVKNGLPSLSGKFQVNEMQEETTIFDWDGHAYQPSLCATVTHRKNIKLPAIAQHACKGVLKARASR